MPERPSFASLAVATALLAASPVSVHAQTPDSLLSAGDTVGAIAALEAILRSEPDRAEAHYRVALLYRTRVDPEAAASADRRRVEEHLRRATQLQPDSAKYWLALAHQMRESGTTTDRVQVPGLLDHALEAARTHGGGVLPQVEYAVARLDWERYEQLGRRYLFIGDARTVDPAVLLGDWDDLEDFFARQVQPDPGDPGAAERRRAEEHLKAALSAEPRFVAAAGLLTVVLGEEDRWEEAYDVARRLVRSAPDSGRARALAGLTLARSNRWSEAQAQFDSALRRMTPAERAPYQHLGPILKVIDEVRFGEMPPDQQRGLSALYWALSQPLFVSDQNEVQVEFLARLTYVDHRWSDPARGYRGWESDRGAVYLRYGPPDIWANFGRGRASQLTDVGGDLVGDPLSSLESERNTIAWVYNASELRFLFSLTPGFTRATFAGDFRAIYREARNVFPVRFDNVPAVAEMDTILVQFAQFRGEGTASTELGVYSFMPIGRMARGVESENLQLTTATILRDPLMRDVQRDKRDEVIRGGDPRQVERRSFRFEMQPGQYLLRVEATLEDARRSARSTSTLNVRAYGTDSLMLSDVIVAERVAPRDSSYRRWTDFFIVPSAGRLGPASPVGLLWEIYNLASDSTGTAHYTVELQITVREVERRGFAARILGGIGDALGLSAQGDDEVTLTYDRDVTPQPGGLQAEYLTVELTDAPKALYGVYITITDKTSGHTVTARRQFLVTDTPLTVER